MMDGQPAFVKRSGEVNPDTLNKLVNDKRKVEETLARLVHALSYVENHPTLLLDNDFLNAINFKVPGCEGCFTDAQEIAIAWEDKDAVKT